MPKGYQGMNLAGESFRNRDLQGFDFNNADIRGADFTNANLEGVNFSNAVAGVTSRWKWVLVVAAVVLAGIMGYVVGHGSYAVVHILNNDDLQEKWRAAFIFVQLLCLTFLLTKLIRQGLKVLIFGVGIIAIAVISLVFIQGEGIENYLGSIILIPISLVEQIGGTLMISIALGITISTGNRYLIATIVAASFLAAIPGWAEGAENNITKGPTLDVLIGILELTYCLATSYIIGRKLARREEGYKFMSAIVVSICSFKGTRFDHANLTDANFTAAKLQNTSFKKAIIKRTCWHKAVNIHHSNIAGTYLEDFAIRQLVISKDGKGGLFDYKDLRGLNLDQASLTDASLIGVDLSEATLIEADLQRAKLAKGRLYGTKLKRSIITGAYIEDWAISTDTDLDGVQCKFIYLRLPTKNDSDPWRKPDNRNEYFKEGDFNDFIAPIVKVLDLYQRQHIDPRQLAKNFKSLDFYHYGGVDPTAAAIALQQLAEENPKAELEVVALEGRGEEKIRLQAAVTRESNANELNADYYRKYDNISSLPSRDLAALITGAAEKEERIRSLERLLENALRQPKMYVETYQNQGEFIMTQSKGNVKITDVQGDISGIATAGESQNMTGVAIGVISDSVTNTISQLPRSQESDNQGIRELLSQLQFAIENEPNLEDEDKSEALEQVKILAEAGKETKNDLLKKSAKTAIKILRGTVAGLPEVTNLVQSCTKLLPAISSLLTIL